MYKEASEGHYLTQGVSVPIEERIVVKGITLAVESEADDWVEITADQRKAYLKEQEERLAIENCFL